MLCFSSFFLIVFVPFFFELALWKLVGVQSQRFSSWQVYVTPVFQTLLLFFFFVWTNTHRINYMQWFCQIRNGGSSFASHWRIGWFCKFIFFFWSNPLFFGCYWTFFCLRSNHSKGLSSLESHVFPKSQERWICPKLYLRPRSFFPFSLYIFVYHTWFILWFVCVCVCVCVWRRIPYGLDSLWSGKVVCVIRNHCRISDFIWFYFIALLFQIAAQGRVVESDSFSTKRTLMLNQPSINSIVPNHMDFHVKSWWRWA